MTGATTTVITVDCNQMNVKETEYQLVEEFERGEPNPVRFRKILVSKGKTSWEAVRGGLILNTDAEWEDEPPEMYKSDEFRTRTRFSMFDAIKTAYLLAESKRKKVA